MKKGGLGTFVPKITLGLMLLCLCLVAFGGNALAAGGGAGTFWLTPQTTTVQTGENFDIVVYVDTGGAKIGSYQVEIDYDQNLLDVTSIEDAGAVSTFVPNDNGDTVNVAGFDTTGAPGGTNVKLFTIHFKALQTAGSTNLTFTKQPTLTDELGQTIGTPNGVGASITIAGSPPPPTPQYTLSVTVNGPGSVTSSPAGINCPSTCTASYDDGTTVTLTATADNQATFVGWSGACTGTGNCDVTMDANKSVTATFVGPGTVGFPTSATTTYENVGNLVVQVCRTDGTSGAASVHFYTVDGTATAGRDYTRSEGTLNWADGEEGCKNISVPIIDNSDEDGPKTFSIRLNNITGAASGTTTLAVTIRDDEAVTAVPTINEWGMIIFTLILMGSGAYYLRKQYI